METLSAITLLPSTQTELEYFVENIEEQIKNGSLKKEELKDLLKYPTMTMFLLNEMCK